MCRIVPRVTCAMYSVRVFMCKYVRVCVARSKRGVKEEKEEEKEEEKKEEESLRDMGPLGLRNLLGL